MTDLAKLKELALLAEGEKQNDKMLQFYTESERVFRDFCKPQLMLELIERLERYEKALKFYADEGSWLPHVDYYRQFTTIDDSDVINIYSHELTDDIRVGGKTARQALADVVEE